jgi:protein-tyrosine phosphatase
LIDYHCHLLSGLDDGPENIEESVAMAAALHNAGFKTIYCTPHAMKGYYDADNKAVLSAVSALRKRLSEENIKLEILPGREYYLDEFLSSYLKHPLPLGHSYLLKKHVFESNAAVSSR